MTGTGAGAGAVDLDALARDTLALAPSLEEGDAEIAVVLYRLLAEGRPVAVSEVALRLGRDPVSVVRTVDGWPGVYRGEGDRIVGFWGLALTDTTHRLEVDGRTLHAWCAFDTLFLPRILDREAVVTSHDGETGEPVRLRVSPDGATTAEPGSVVLSFLRSTDASTFAGDVISNFCHHILFFTSAERGRRWMGERDDVVLLSLDEGVELAGRWVDSLFGEAVVPDPTIQGPGA